MKVSIILVILSIMFFSIEAEADKHDCLGLVYALNNCINYSCSMDFLNDEIRYTIFGMRGNNCKMSESDASGVTLCYFPEDKLKIMSEYFVRILTNNMNVNTNKIENVLFRVCEFFPVFQETLIPENEEITEDNALKMTRAAELKKRNSNIGKIKSIFFSSDDIVRLHTIYAQDRNTRQNN